MEGIVGRGDGTVLRPKKLGVGRAVLMVTMLHTAVFLKAKFEPITPCLHSSWKGDQIPTKDSKVCMVWLLGPLISADPKLPSLCSVSITRFASTSGLLHLWFLSLGHSPSQPQGTPTHLSDLSLITASGRSLPRSPRPGQLPLLYILILLPFGTLVLACNYSTHLFGGSSVNVSFP